jgi:trans-2,3-dihydro-3-hydroxyanthranilate isomerase
VKRLAFHTLDVFTDKRLGGNPLAVVLEADGLKQGHMQAIAREFNLSETVFIQKATAPGALVRARIFTPFEELPFAGHPTIGTACLLADLGIAPEGPDVRFVLEEGIGDVAVRVTRHGHDAPFGELTTAQLPQSGPAAPDAAAIARVLGLEPDALSWNDERPRHSSCGLPVLLVPLRMPELLAGITVDVTALNALFDGAWAHNLYVYARGYEGELRARMFSPTVAEDPATGSAGAALAGRLAIEAAQAEGTLEWTVHQGVEMGRPSVLHLAADKSGGQVVAVRVGGHAVRITEGILHAD